VEEGYVQEERKLMPFVEIPSANVFFEVFERAIRSVVENTYFDIEISKAGAEKQGELFGLAVIQMDSKLVFIKAFSSIVQIQNGESTVDITRDSGSDAIRIVGGVLLANGKEIGLLSQKVYRIKDWEKRVGRKVREVYTVLLSKVLKQHEPLKAILPKEVSPVGIHQKFGLLVRKHVWLDDVPFQRLKRRMRNLGFGFSNELKAWFLSEWKE